MWGKIKLEIKIRIERVKLSGAICNWVGHTWEPIVSSANTDRTRWQCIRCRKRPSRLYN